MRCRTSLGGGTSGKATVGPARDAAAPALRSAAVTWAKSDPVSLDTVFAMSTMRAPKEFGHASETAEARDGPPVSASPL